MSVYGRLNRWVLRSFLGTVTVPKDARVDSNRFPEDEFPVYCLKCGYLLRGLPDGACPECAERFERGTLLVQEYARDLGERDWRRSKWGWLERWAARIVTLWVVWVILYAAASIALSVCVARGNMAMPRWTSRIRVGFLAGFMVLPNLVGAVCLMVQLVLLYLRMRRYDRKRKAVLRAIPAAPEGGSP